MRCWPSKVRKFNQERLLGQKNVDEKTGERAGLQAIRSVVPDFCPRPLGSGNFASSPTTSFLLIEFLQLSSSSFPLLSGFLDSFSPRPGLAQKLAALHTTPAPIPAGFDRAQFGFPVATYCGDTPQDNSYKESWAEFFGHNRLLAALKRCEANRGEVAGFRELVEAVASRVVPRLLDHRHLNNGNGIVPVVVHGDLWCGNAARGKIADGPVTDVVFDPSACCAHSEYELGIMKMFGGFGKAFLREYHRLCPRPSRPTSTTTASPSTSCKSSSRSWQRTDHVQLFRYF